MVTKPSCFDVAQKNSDSIIHRTQPPPRTHPTTPTLLAVTTDIQIWVSKTMQPFRTHTPTFSLIPDERRANVDASSLSECSTPQRRVGPRKKPSSYFSSKTPKYLEDPGLEIWATEAVGDDASSPDITMMVDAIFIKICNRPFDGLPAHMNSSVLHIIEAYRDLSMEKEQLDEQLGGRDKSKSRSTGAEASMQAISGGGNVPREDEDIRTFLMADTDKDFQDLTRMASRVARSRDLSVDQILPKLVELFDDLKELDIPTKLEIMQRAPTGPMIRRPPSWVLGDDAFDPRDSVVILTVRSPLRTMDSFALSCCDIPSDLSASTSDKSDGGSVMKRLPKIPSLTYDKGQVFSRQEQRSCVVTVFSHNRIWQQFRPARLYCRLGEHTGPAEAKGSKSAFTFGVNSTGWSHDNSSTPKKLTAASHGPDQRSTVAKAKD
ncbi:hypothetical protein MPH_12208 [Macrophomina phaseolina MS6]|uniref:Uncharacterized protein n=1 Tax=Macrophomina phaseolina (strain MS6) TaxID=1126212 RepID=K2RKP3_MACPH|nr:hypothetical protein MPH_12208 [Macrophomina phaseolina MS6]